MITVERSKTSVSQTLVFKWYKRFQEHGDSIQELSGRVLKSSVTKKTVATICDALNGDR